MTFYIKAKKRAGCLKRLHSTVGIINVLYLRVHFIVAYTNNNSHINIDLSLIMISQTDVNTQTSNIYI